MNELMDARSRAWAAAAVIGGVVLYLGLEWNEEPHLTWADLLLELIEIFPIVLTSVGLLLLFRVMQRPLGGGDRSGEVGCRSRARDEPRDR
jgi:hypothetical protein